MNISEIMKTNVEYIDPSTKLTDAARKMQQSDIGLLPVGENDRLIGTLTDRDIVVRGLANGKDPAALTARDAMSQKTLYVFDDQTVSEAAENMANNQVRRLPVLNRDKRLVGIISLGDIAKNGQAQQAGEALSAIVSH